MPSTEVRSFDKSVSSDIFSEIEEDEEFKESVSTESKEIEDTQSFSRSVFANASVYQLKNSSMQSMTSSIPLSPPSIESGMKTSLDSTVIANEKEFKLERSYSQSASNVDKKELASKPEITGQTGHSANESRHEKESGHHGIALWGWRWQEVNSFIVVSLFLLTAALVKLAYHHTSLHHHLPESCVLIILGTVFELLSFLSHLEQYIPQFSSRVFFFLLLPPIILESAYSLHDRVFFTNIGTILLYAIVGTLINIFLIGPSLYLSSFFGLFGKEIVLPLIECLVFSTLISAVDPVAVLAIFQDIGVNKSLYFLVFGESLLNDAVVITVYNVMTEFADSTDISAANVFLGIMNFVTVSGGGLFIGLLYGVVTALITRFTQNVRVVEPMIVIVIAYMSYVTAELFHFSGIIGIIGCGLMQIEYAKHNISQRSFVTIKYFMKNLSTISDVIIFFFLGKVLVRQTHVWSTTFALAATLFCIIYRFLSVFSLTWVANKVFHRIHCINFEEQLVMAYGGLRGAIAFSLAISLDKDDVKNSKLFVSSTLFVILFTVFVLGSTTKAMVKLLRVKTEEKQDPKMLLFLTDKVIESCMTGIEDVTGNQTYFHWINRLSQWNEKYFKRLMVRGWLPASSEFTSTFNKIKSQRPKSIISLMVNRGSIVSNLSFNRGKNNQESQNPEVTSQNRRHSITSPTSISNRNLNNNNHAVKFSQSVSRLDVNGTVEHSNRSESSPKRPSATKSTNAAPKWNLLRNVVSFTARMTRTSDSRRNNDDPGVSTPPSRSGSRKQSLITLMREDSQERQHNQVKRQLNSALTRTSFYHLPGSIFIEDTDDQRMRASLSKTHDDKSGQISNSLGSNQSNGYSRRSAWNTRRRSSVQDESLLSSRTDDHSVNRSTRMTTGTTVGSLTTTSSREQRNKRDQSNCC